MRLSTLRVFPAIGLMFLACEGPNAGETGSTETSRFREARIPIEGGFHLYARVLGNGPDTVIIPGSMYLAQDLQPLVSGRTLIFYDPRCRGGSDTVVDTTKIGIGFDVMDLEAVREYFRLDRFSLIGWSYMGALVALYAAEHPEHVVRVVQVGPVPPRSETAAAYHHPVSAPDSVSLAHLAELRGMGHAKSDPVGYCREWLRLQLLPSIMAQPQAVGRTKMDPCIYWNEWPDQVFTTLGRIMPPVWDYTAQAALITAPVLTVHGIADPSAPIEGGREWASLISNHRLVEIEEVGHVPFLEARDRFFEEVATFLAGG